MSSASKMKWTPVADQQLLLTIIQTHGLSVDCGKVAEAWESKDGSMPTARAVKERIAKIKEMAKTGGGSATPNPSPTPKKTRAARGASSGGKGKSPASRAPQKRNRDNESASPAGQPAKKSSKEQTGTGIEDEEMEDEGVMTPMWQHPSGDEV